MPVTADYKKEGLRDVVSQAAGTKFFFNQFYSRCFITLRIHGQTPHPTPSAVTPNERNDKDGNGGVRELECQGPT